MASTKTTITTWAMRPSVRPTTASSKSGITWTCTITCSSQSTTSTPMTTFTQTLAWCTSCGELAHSAHSCTWWCRITPHLGSSPESFHIHPWSSWRTLFDSHPFSTSTCSPVSFPSTSSTPTVLWARQPDRHGKPVPLRQQGERGRLRRLHSPHRLWAQLRDLRRAQRLIGSLTQETRTVLTASFLKTPELRKCAMDQGNLMSEIARTHRSGLYMMNRDRWLSRNIAKKSVITNSKQLTQKKIADSYEAHQQSLTEMKELRKF